MKTKLYTWERQKQAPYPTGFEVEEHLKEKGLYDRTLSLDDDVVKRWLEKPETYPEEYKSVYPYLWKSQRTGGSYCGVGSQHVVAYLYWDGDRVIVHWYWLEYRWSGYDPVLLASNKSTKIPKVKKVKEIPERIEYKGRVYKLEE